MGLAVVSLLVLAVLGLLGGLLAFRVFGQAARGEETRPHDAGDQEGSRRTGSDEGDRRAARLLFVRLVSVVGVLGAVVGMIADVNSTFVVTTVGILLGVLGFGLGARRAGIAAVAASLVLLLFGLAAINGFVPGLNPPGYEQQKQQ